MHVRAVIDTNIWVSSLINPFGFPAVLRRAFEEGAFHLIISEALVEELTEVLSRPRIRNKYEITEEDVKELLTLIEERTDNVFLAGYIDICRDKDDNAVIETAINGRADYIESRDDDLKFDKDVSEYLFQHGIAAFSLSRFLSLINIG